MAAKRLTRREIVQQDRIRQALTLASSWILENRNQLLAALALLAVLALGFYGWQVFSGSRAERIQGEFAQALRIYHAAIGEPSPEEVPEVPSRLRYDSDEERLAKALQAFQALADEHSGYRLADLASYYIALVQNEQGQSEEAKRVLNDLVDRTSHGDIRNMARNVLAQVAVADGDQQQATQLWSEILDDPNSALPMEIVRFRLAQSYEAQGDTAQAVAHYRQITTEHPGTEYSTRAQTRLDLIAPEEDTPSQTPEPPPVPES